MKGPPAQLARIYLLQPLRWSKGLCRFLIPIGPAVSIRLKRLAQYRSLFVVKGQVPDETRNYLAEAGVLESGRHLTIRWHQLPKLITMHGYYAQARRGLSCDSGLRVY